MSERNRKYHWQIEVSPHNSTEILDQMEFLEKLLENDPKCLVIPLDEQSAIHEELSRLAKMWTAAITGELDKRLEAAKQAERQADPWYQFRQLCYEWRYIIWLLLPGFLLTLLMMPPLDRDLPWMFPSWCVMFALYLAWAIWASKVPEE